MRGSRWYAPPRNDDDEDIRVAVRVVIVNSVNRRGGELQSSGVGVCFSDLLREPIERYRDREVIWFTRYR